jgi:AAA domain
MTPSGIVLVPTKDGKPMQDSDYLALTSADKKRLEESRGEIEKKVEDTLREGKKLERETAEKLEAAETQVANYLLRLPFTELKEKYRDYPKVIAYLDSVRDHV